jgi:hypothetical protein
MATIRPIWRSLFLAVVLVSSCSVFDPVPGHQVTLTGSRWSVVVVDDEPFDTAHRPVVRFSDSAEKVTITTECRSAMLDYAMDTDGAALSFAPPSVEPSGCDQQARLRDSELFAALAANEAWSVGNENEITFHGPPIVQLQRLVPPRHRSTRRVSKRPGKRLANTAGTGSEVVAGSRIDCLDHSMSRSRQ